MEAKVLDVSGKEVGKCELPESIFGHKPSRTFLHEYVTIYLANQRQYGAHTKSRSEVSGGGRKPWKQKHTGRARAGSIRSGLWRHGAIIHGPRSGYGSHLDFPRQKAQARPRPRAVGPRAGRRPRLRQGALAEGGQDEADGRPHREARRRGPRAHRARRAQRRRRRAPAATCRPSRSSWPRTSTRTTSCKCKKLIITQPALEKLGARWN